MDRLEFWQKIVDLLSRLEIRRQVENGTIDKTDEWIVKSVVPSLLKMQTAKGAVAFWSRLRDILEECDLTSRAKAQIVSYWEIHGVPDLGEVISFEPLPI